MLRGMYAGVSGLRTHQYKMDVIGNNIANVNTVGFKRSTASFKEVFNQTLKSASGSQEGRSGTNPQQVGLGVGQGSTSVVHTQGAAQTTDNPLDVMIDGNSFFVLSNDSSFINRFYSRAGNFQIDEQGSLSSADGYRVLGYKVDENGGVSNEVGELIINKADTMAPTSTKKIEMIGNLNSSSPSDAVAFTDTRIYDSLGNSYTARFKMNRTADTPPAVKSNSWDISLETVTDSHGAKLYDVSKTDGNTIGIGIGTGTETGFNAKVEFTSNGNIVSLNGSNTTQGFKANLSLSKTDSDSAFGEITIDFSQLKQYGSDFTVEARRKDGNTAGNVDSFAINDKGELTARYTNGESKTLGMLALAKFENNSGLEKLGGNLYQNSRNSGDAVLGKAAQQGYGVLAPGRLEMSNVDLSYEFTEMITTQRGFQANSRIITTNDEMLQELVNLKR